MRVPTGEAEARSLGLAWLVQPSLLAAPEHRKVQVAERRKITAIKKVSDQMSSCLFFLSADYWYQEL